MRNKWFNFAVLLLFATWLVSSAAGCAPMRNRNTNADGEFMALAQRIIGRKNDFRITDTIIYPNVEMEGLTNPSTSVTDEELTKNRCMWCHNTCGFERAFDWENYGSGEWAPKYVGDEWMPVVDRMMRKQGSFLSEEVVVRRIYAFLEKVTTGAYDAETDIGSQKVTIEVSPEEFEELSNQQTPPAEHE